MKTGRMDLAQLLVELQRRRETKLDYLVNTGTIDVAVADQGSSKSVALVVPTSQGVVTLAANSLAHAQLAEHAGIPKPYYDRLLAEEPELLAENVNKWLHKYPENRMIRTLDGTARAVLSDRYRPLDYEDLAEVVVPALLSLDVEIVSQEITERRFYIKAVDKRVVRALADKGAAFGDGGHTIVHRSASPAITISDSEVGLGGVGVNVGLYDDFCSNLSFFKERSLRKYHVGAKHELLGENIAGLLSDETRRKTDEATWAQVGDVVRGAFDRVKFDALVDKVEGTIADKIEGDVAKVITLSSKKFGLTEAEGKSVLQRLIEGGSATRFGLYNAVTRVAQDIEDYDRATEFENLGGQIIDLPRSEWQEVLKQAA